MREQIEYFKGTRDRYEKRSKQINKNVAELKKGRRADWTKFENYERLAQRAKHLGIDDDAESLIHNPDDSDIGQLIYEKIIDSNNLLPVNFLSQGARKANAVGRIVIPTPGGRKLGTGFMVSPRVMMTNNHVLENKQEAGLASLEFDYYERENGDTGPKKIFKLQPEQFFVTHEQLDFSLVAIEQQNVQGDKVADRGWFPLFSQSGKAVVGERVSIIQHPNGDPQKIVVHDNQIVDIDFNSDFLHYIADTMGGSSGSPVLNMHWDLVALHHAAVRDSNEGIRISSVVKKLIELFNQGSESSNEFSAIAKELLEANRPPSQTQLPGAPSLFEKPIVNDDGTISYVVPFRVNLGINPANLLSHHQHLLTSTGTVIPSTDGNTSSGFSGAPLTPDPGLLSDAKKAFESGNKKVYYSKVKDEKARDEYYPDLSNQGPDALFNTLNDLLSSTHHTTLSYKNARLIHLYPWIDRREGSARPLKGIYSNKTFEVMELIEQEVIMEIRREQAMREFLARESTEIIDEDFLEQLEAAHPFNCEHVVPQSWFDKRKQPKTDLHHLFTCEWGCNSFRGNRAYFDFSTEAYRENCGESEIGKFEPKYGKGAVARVTLYFLVRYPKDVADSNKEMPKDRLKWIIDWAKNDKVDRWERHRNAEIQKVQGNRNPFIDFPDLVNKVNFEASFA